MRLKIQIKEGEQSILKQHSWERMLRRHNPGEKVLRMRHGCLLSSWSPPVKMGALLSQLVGSSHENHPAHCPLPPKGIFFFCLSCISLLVIVSLSIWLVPLVFLTLCVTCLYPLSNFLLRHSPFSYWLESALSSDIKLVLYMFQIDPPPSI